MDILLVHRPIDETHLRQWAGKLGIADALEESFREAQTSRRAENPHVVLPPFPLNAPGDFYVEDGQCIACGAPEIEAPDLMSHMEDSYEHCYFKKQPTTPIEIDQAVQAVKVSCCRAVRYGGKDPAILQLFDEKEC